MTDFINYKNVGVSATHIWEAHKGRIVEELVRSKELIFQLEYGSPEPKPLVSTILGCALLIPGFVFIEHMFFLISEGSSANLRYEAVMLTFGLLGSWLIFKAIFQKRHYIRASTKSQSHKLVFSADADLHGIRSFLAQAKRDYQFDIKEESKS